MAKLKRVICLLLVSALVLLCGCDANKKDSVSSENGENSLTITDSEGNSVTLKSSPKIVSCSASLSECWLLAGGTLTGITEDVISERGLLKEGDANIVGSVKSIDLEKVTSLNPDYVIMSADLTAHKELEPNLKNLGINYGYFREDTFEDYKFIMSEFCNITGREDLYTESVLDTEEKIKEILSKIPENNTETALLARVFSTGMKAKTDDNPAGIILKDFKVKNIADDYPSALEDLSLEVVVKSDPDFLLFYAMGDEESAKSYLSANLENSPAFKDLKSVKNKTYHLLPKELFQYKPNNRWDESYEYLAKIIYPEIFK